MVASNGVAAPVRAKPGPDWPPEVAPEPAVPELDEPAEPVAPAPEAAAW